MRRCICNSSAVGYIELTSACTALIVFARSAEFRYLRGLYANGEIGVTVFAP